MLPTTIALSTQAPAASTDRALRAATIDLLKRLAEQFPQLAAGSKDQRVLVGEWAQGLAGMSSDEIERGMAACRTRRFAPGIGEFAQLCRPALDPAWAWEEARDGLQARSRGEVGDWSHPAVFRAACALSYEIRTSSFTACRIRWERELQQEFSRGRGEDVPPPPPRIEHRPTVIGMPANIRRKLISLGVHLK